MIALNIWQVLVIGFVPAIIIGVILAEIIRRITKEDKP